MAVCERVPEGIQINNYSRRSGSHFYDPEAIARDGGASIEEFL
jgi:hypothetical protein